MPAKTPLTTKSTAGYVNPQGSYYASTSDIASGTITQGTVTNNLKSDVAAHRNNLAALKHTMWFFTDIDTTDTWTSGIEGIQMVAWTPADATDDLNTAVCTTVATGVITFVATNANSEGWLHVWSTG